VGRWGACFRPICITALLLSLLTGCGSGAARLQEQVDRANKLGLQSPEVRTYLIMFWDDKPQEWLILSDHFTADGLVLNLTAYLGFLGGRLDRQTRRLILDAEEIHAPTPLHVFHAESIGKKQAAYESASREVSAGKVWSGRAFTTVVHPKGVAYRTAGELRWDGRQIRLLVGDVTIDRAKDPGALYPHVRQVVGLDASSGELVFEYLANLEPWTRAGYANRMLYVHDRSDLLILRSGFMQASHEERSGRYLDLRQRLVELEALLRAKAALPQASGS
jgi:hypothetical protein